MKWARFGGFLLLRGVVFACMAPKLISFYGFALFPHASCELQSAAPC